MCAPQLDGSSPASGKMTSTMPITAVIAPAVCLIRPPMARANRPSTVRYRPDPTTACSTPGWLSDTVIVWGTLTTRPAICAWSVTTCPFTRAAPIKNDKNATISPTTITSAAKTTPLASTTG